MLRNLGSIKNSGIEAVLTATLVDRRAFSWDITLAGSHLSNKIVSLGYRRERTSEQDRRHRREPRLVSVSVNGWFYRPYTFNDDNGDGLLHCG